MVRVGRIGLFGLVLAAAIPGVSEAQSVALSDILPSLIGPETVINAQGSLPGIGHTAHFVPDFSQQITPTLINNALRSQLPTFPVGSSSGGFTYIFDPAIGAPRRNSRSFGPSFAERPLTNGRGRWSAGFNYQHTNYNSLEGQSLENGDIKFYVKHNDCCPGQDPVTGVRPGPASPATPAFEADVIEEDVTIHVKSDVAAFFATYGVTNRFDIGIAVPIVRVSMDARVDSTMLRLGTGNDLLTHRFTTGDGTHLSNGKSGEASGVGDVLLRAKYVAIQGQNAALAGGIDVRLPSGDAANLLGTGKTSTKLYAIVAGGTDRVSPHVNFGYTFGGGNDNGVAAHPDEVNYVGGADVALTNRVTAAVDIIGRTLRGTGRVQNADVTFNANPPAGVTSLTRSEFTLLPNDNLNLLLGAAGVKINVGKTLLITANVLFPLSDAGLKPGITPVIGLDYSFK